jgi:hypothetical protein
MASLDEHCRDCEKILGKPYREVHIYLDELFATMGLRHRVARHHIDGVKEIEQKWGKEAAQAAEIHIRKDCYGQVPTKEQAMLWDILT